MLSRCASARMAIVAVLAVLLGLAVQLPAQAVQAAQSAVVAAKPQTNTPDVRNGTVYAIGQVGNKVFLGGSFSSVAPHASTAAVARANIVAFDSTTGAIDTGFVPTINGEVDAVVAGPGNTVYVAGTFTTVNGVATRVALLDATTGAIVSTWRPPTLTGTTATVVLSGTTVYVGGAFQKVGSAAHAGIVALNATTGAVVPSFTVQLTGRHGQVKVGPLGAKKIDINPAGTAMVVIGNFTSATDTSGTYPRDQVVRVNLGGTSATVDQGWNTLQYSAQCFNNSFDSYIRDLSYSPDGSYFVIVATGGSGTNTDGSRSLCDTATRWESSDTGANVQPTWVDYTGQDSLWSVAVTGTAIYVGGHQRWLNNGNASDTAGAGAVPRPGLGALDPANGLPLSWNPGRNPRGAGAYALLATSTGLWVGSDTDYIGNFQYKHMKVAFFPLAGGTALPASKVGTLPGNVYLAGPSVNAHPEVLYRVNAGGPAVAAPDNGPDWAADTSDASALRNSGSNAAGYSPSATPDASVPAGTPSAIFDSERWDPGSNGDGGEMKWDFPVAAGTTVKVRLYFANRCSCTSTTGSRVFDVALEGQTVLDHLDLVAAAGDQTGTMKEFSVVSDGDVTIDLTHEVENPLVNGIEIIQTDPTPPAPTNGDSLLSRHLDSSGAAGPATTVDTSTMDWTAVRGAFMVNGTLYYGKSDGSLNQRSFDGTAFGPEVVVDPYNDPYWSTAQTGSGQTYRGLASGLSGELPNVSSLFYDGGRVYYTLVGRSELFYRYFTPDSGIVGAAEFTASTSGSGADFSGVAGAFVTGSTLYYATKADGVLHSVAWSTDHPTGSPSVVDSSGSWAAHGMFLLSQPPRVNRPPVAAFTSSCPTGTLSCSFDAGTSTDPDGSVTAYDWTFGDGSTAHSSSPTLSHPYATAGSYAVKLTVTDNDGATSSSTSSVRPTAPHAAISFLGRSSQATTGTTMQVTVPATAVAGSALLLFETYNSTTVTAADPAGWTLVKTATGGTAITTKVFTKLAAAGDPGTTVRSTFSGSVKLTATLAAYSGTSGSPVGVIASSTDSASATHTSPVAAVPSDGSWVLSYWSDKSVTPPTAWTTPADLTVRSLTYGTGSGATSAALADSATPVTAGSYGGKVATVNTTSTKGLNLTVSLTPSS